jgi:hypothetical protein
MEFLKENAGKLGLVVVLLGVTIGLYFFSVGRSVESRIGDTLTYVCVETGETFTFPRGKVRIPPVENPKTGRRTLLACYERDGKLFVRGRERALLGELGVLNKVVDTETLQVTLPP